MADITEQAIASQLTGPAQDWGRAVYYRQKELNEIRDALAVPVTATHDQVIATITELIREHRGRTD